MKPKWKLSNLHFHLLDTGGKEELWHCQTVLSVGTLHAPADGNTETIQFQRSKSG